MIDTGASKTFIHYKSLQKMKYYNLVKQHKHAFVLADGFAPFHVLGTVQLSIMFADQLTTIQAYVAQNLCTDVIVGMDYISLYNLKIDTRNQLLSIELDNRTYYMKTQQNYVPQLIPIHLSKSLHLPPRSDRSITVSTPISSITSPFIPHKNFLRNTTLRVPHTLLQVQNYLSTITLCNPTYYAQHITKGLCVGFIYSSFVPQRTYYTVGCKKNCRCIYIVS
jgi:hypothetical protein